MGIQTLRVRGTCTQAKRYTWGELMRIPKTEVLTAHIVELLVVRIRCGILQRQAPVLVQFPGIAHDSAEPKLIGESAWEGGYFVVISKGMLNPEGKHRSVTKFVFHSCSCFIAEAVPTHGDRVVKEDWRRGCK